MPPPKPQAKHRANYSHEAPRSPPTLPIRVNPAYTARVTACKQALSEASDLAAVLEELRAEHGRLVVEEALREIGVREKRC